ncbi:hypothetical protein TrLO_g1055 [Triparma laevis f. longispina]|uniref:Uncharacterized protein n=1 Tax=Triparma laevis f. longispina TaxID=1714387 RepID=A0A9W6ZYN7_9STRA|nr:hypothetical protein TrLO_g1055 [Triparma laevis f. longispina]
MSGIMRRRSSINEVMHPDGELGKVENLRSSLADMKEAFASAVADVKKEEEFEQRARAVSAARLAAGLATHKTEMKAKVMNVAAEAAKKGVEVVESQHVKVNKKALGAIVKDAVKKIDDKDKHDDGVKVEGGVVPEWQKEGRVRGSSVAMDAASLINAKTDTKRRGSAVAIDATKMAIFKGVAEH